PVSNFFGWTWRFLVGFSFCTTYGGSVFVLGWLSRYMQAVTVRSWWKRSRFRKKSTFAEYCNSLGPDAPAIRPRWFLRERLRQGITWRLPSGERPEFHIVAWRILVTPIHSLWRNYWIGLKMFLGTFLLAGWGGLIMTYSWEFGWHNSFHKGYE